MKKRNEDDPDILGGLGDMLPAEVLKKLNELLERLHQAESNHHGSTVINIYEKGSLHMDHVDNQYFGDKWAKAFQGKEPPKSQTPPNISFDDSTPLSALFRENHHKELRQIIDSWRPYLIGDAPTIEALAMTRFEFNFRQTRPVSVYMDLARLINHDALSSPMSILSAFMFRHSNLSRSENALYVQLKRYKKLCK